MPEAVKERTLKQRLLHHGYSETMTYSFIDAGENQRFSTLEPVRLKNPLSRETEVMRTSLVPGLLASFLQNYNRGMNSVRLYEMGRIYPMAGRFIRTTDDQPENLFLGIIASGNVQEKTVHADARPWNFFDLKGDLEMLLESLSIPLDQVTWQAEDSGAGVPPYYHPGVASGMKLRNDSLGVFGQLHPKVCEAYKIKQPVFLAEIPLAPWYRFQAGEHLVEEPAKFPAVRRDLSLVIDQSLNYRAIESTVLEAGILEVRKCFPFDLYLGEKLPSGKKGVSISIVYQAFDRTLVEEEVNGFHEKIVNLLQTKLGAQLRT